MAIFQEIEKRLEDLFEGIFSRSFRTAIHPVELAKKLAKAMDRDKTVSIDKVYVPNEYIVHLSKADFEKLAAFHDSLASELKSYLHAHAGSKKYDIPPGLKIDFIVDDSIDLGELRIETKLRENKTSSERAKIGHTQIISADEVAELGLYAGNKGAVLVHLETGDRHPLSGNRLTIGRQQDNDVVINDPSVSRRHAVLERHGPTYIITDLNSTNGTQVNQSPVEKAVLEDEDRVTLGKTDFIFRS